MCPSYMVTREEEHSTRGRSRLLFEMLAGHADSPVTGGWRSTEVRDALDLCLACKGCKRDCPVEVDMATMKAEFLAHHYAGRLRPLAHYSMGWLPAVAQLASRAPRLVNAVSQAPVLRDAVTAAGGIDRRRRVPLFARQSLQAWHARRDPGPAGLRGEVVLWPDTFTNHLTPGVGQAAVEVLEAAGWRVIVPDQPLCCGLTWISTGQLATARRVLQRTVDALAPHLQRGTKIVGLEPSCTAVFRSDARELMPGNRDVERLGEQTVTLAELLRKHTDGWQPPQVGGQAIAQTHCHQHAIMGYDQDQALLRDAGIDLDVLDAGCCGLAGNFGFEAGHYDVSMACGERALLPAVRDAPRRTPWCWPTDSAAAPRSSRVAPAGRRCTWPRSWPPGCTASRSGRYGPRRRALADYLRLAAAGRRRAGAAAAIRPPSSGPSGVGTLTEHLMASRARDSGPGARRMPRRPGQVLPRTGRAASVPAPWMITPPTALPAAMAVVMTAKVQANASVELAAGTARWTEALSDPSQGESGSPSGIMSRARTIRPGAAASSMRAAPNSARQPMARPSTRPPQSRLPYARPPARLPSPQIATSTPAQATPPCAPANATSARLSIPAADAVAGGGDEQDAQPRPAQRAGRRAVGVPAIGGRRQARGVKDGARHADDRTGDQRELRAAGGQQEREQQRTADPDELLPGGIERVGGVDLTGRNEPRPHGPQRSLDGRSGQARHHGQRVELRRRPGGRRPARGRPARRRTRRRARAAPGAGPGDQAPARSSGADTAVPMPNAPAANPAVEYEPVPDRTRTTMAVAAMLSGMRATSVGSSSRAVPGRRRMRV